MLAAAHKKRPIRIAFTTIFHSRFLIRVHLPFVCVCVCGISTPISIDSTRLKFLRVETRRGKKEHEMLLKTNKEIFSKE